MFQILPPTADISPPEAVPVLVPTLVPVAQPIVEITDSEIKPTVQLDDERLEELMSRLSVQTDEELVEFTVEKLNGVLAQHKSILTVSY